MVSTSDGGGTILRNVQIGLVDHFRRTREVIDLIDLSEVESILAATRDCAARNPGTAELLSDNRPIVPVTGSVPARMVSDPAGYFVICPDPARSILSLEHFTNNGVLTTIIEGGSAAELYMTAIERNLVFRLDHAAYLGRELARAEHAQGRHLPRQVCGQSEGSPALLPSPRTTQGGRLPSRAAACRVDS
jgi:tetrahydromethanopterin S-methyltransferase subunit A